MTKKKMKSVCRVGLLFGSLRALVVLAVSFVVSLIVVVVVVGDVNNVASAFHVVRQRLPGIWRLILNKSSNPLPLPFQPQEEREEADLFRSRLEDLFLTTTNARENKVKQRNDNDELEEDCNERDSDIDRKSILLSLNEDGSFQQCTDDQNLDALLLSGVWDVCVDDATDTGHCNQQLVLAFDRRLQKQQENQQLVLEQDVILEGSFLLPAQQQELTTSTTCSSSNLLQVEGQVFQGRFMYSTKHPAFFEQPLVHRQAAGPFSLLQTLPAWWSALTESNHPNHTTTSTGPFCFQPADFYNRSFYMTVQPVQYKYKSTKNNNKKKQRDNNNFDDDDDDNYPFDLQAMPITFYANNTFQAWGMNKILRGRFTITDDQLLSFQVSLFGAGRSLKGSVWSQGMGLTHEDQRSYLGSILLMHHHQHQQDNNEKEKGGAPIGRGHLLVKGTVTFGSDLGTDARPEPVGYFVMTETMEENPRLAVRLLDEEEEDEEFDGDDEGNSDAEGDGEVHSAFQ